MTQCKSRHAVIAVNRMHQASCRDFWEASSKHAAKEHSTVLFTSIVWIHFYGVLEWLNLELHGRCGCADGAALWSASLPCSRTAPSSQAQQQGPRPPFTCGRCIPIPGTAHACMLASRLSLPRSSSSMVYIIWQAIFAKLPYAAPTHRLPLPVLPVLGHPALRRAPPWGCQVRSLATACLVTGPSSRLEVICQYRS